MAILELTQKNLRIIRIIGFIAFVSDIVRTAGKSIVIIDNYIDDSVLTLFSKRNKNDIYVRNL